MSDDPTNRGRFFVRSKATGKYLALLKEHGGRRLQRVAHRPAERVRVRSTLGCSAIERTPEEILAEIRADSSPARSEIDIPALICRLAKTRCRS